MKKTNELGVNIIPIKLFGEENSGLEYIYSNGSWFTRINNTHYPVLAMVTTTSRYLIAVDESVLRTVWFELIDGEYILQSNKFYSMIDYTVYDLTEYTLVKDMYVPFEQGVFKRSISIGANGLFTTGHYCFRTFDDTIFSLREVLTGSFICHNKSLALKDILVFTQGRYVNQMCKVVFLTTTAYCYWTDTEIVYVTEQETHTMSRKEAVLSLAVRDRFFVAFSDVTYLLRGCLKGDYVLGKEGVGVFEFAHKRKWDYLYIEGSSIVSKALSSFSFALSQKLFYDYYYIGADLYIVLSNGSIVATTIMEFHETILSVKVILLPITSVVVVETTDQICSVQCTIVEGVIQCQELDFH